MASARLTPAVIACEVAVAPLTASTELLPEARMVPAFPTYRLRAAGVRALAPVSRFSRWSVTATPVTLPSRSTPTTIVMGPPKP